MAIAPIAVVIGSIVAIAVTVLVIVFVLVPLFRGIGWAIGAAFRGIGWFIAHIANWLFGTIGDLVRFVGGIPVFLIFALLSLLNVVIGRWSAAGHFADNAQRECGIGFACLYRAIIRRPLQLVMLHGLLEGIEQRVPEAMEGAPGRDTPTRRTGQFDGYTIVGSLRAGGSGGKLYVAEPTDEKRKQIPDIPDRVVIKSFALTDGSSLPQIVRESRALECAKSLGHVIEHGMNPARFHYVMPYIPGDHLAMVTRELHARSTSSGLSPKALREGVDYIIDLASTLSSYHRGGFWHKDVKPENVIIHDGRAHLVDLGLVTPLQSAMTLTTHGTEYFRDPEMVRQALRGVRVHQVDGAKFDVFAVGAVLYFLLENTFPAHGGLSSFTKKSPEALKWIVRRAMADYQQRYRSADELLADLRVVAQASDPFSVKPGQLPSMGGESPEQFDAGSDEPADDPNRAGAAWAAAGRMPHAQPVAAGVPAGAGPTAVGAVGGVAAAAAAEAVKPRRPKLKVTNWWTGAYEVEDDGLSAPATEYTFGNVARESVHRRAEARRKAHEQVAAARARAEAMRKRVKDHRHARLRHPSERQPGIFIGFLSVLFLGGILTTAFYLQSMRSDSVTADHTSAMARVAPAQNGLRVLALIDSERAEDPDVLTQAARHITNQRRSGYDVRFAGEELQDELLPLVKNWKDDSRKYDAALEDALEAQGLYGVYYLKDRGSRSGRVRFEPTLIRSTREGADARRGFDDAGRVLVINDRPSTTPNELFAFAEKYLGQVNTLIEIDGDELQLRDLIALAEAESPDATRELDELLASFGVAGVVWVQPPSPERPDDVSRHLYAPAVPALPAAPDSAFIGRGRTLLVIVDHPLTDEAVRAQIDRVLEDYEARGFVLSRGDVELESSARLALELMQRESATGSERFETVLDENDLDGVLIIDTVRDTEGRPTDRVRVRQLAETK